MSRRPPVTLLLSEVNTDVQVLKKKKKKTRDVDKIDPHPLES